MIEKAAEEVEQVSEVEYTAAVLGETLMTGGAITLAVVLAESGDRTGALAASVLTIPMIYFTAKSTLYAVRERRIATEQNEAETGQQ